MPSLVAFGHRWGVGSDDLAVPSAIESTASIIWLGTFGRILYSQYHILASVPGGIVTRYVLISGAVLNSYNLLILGCLIHTSFKGTVINTKPRERAATLLGLKLVYEACSLALCAGSVRLLYTSSAVGVPGVYKTLRGATRSLCVLTGVSSAVLWHILNPNKRKRHHEITQPRDLEKDEPVSEVVRCTWKERFHSLGKFLGIEGHPALNKVGKLFSDFFQEESDIDIVTTDVIAALMLMKKEQGSKFERLARNSPGLVQSPPSLPTPQPWMNPHEAAHYMKYAAGTYGWPMYIFKSRMALWGFSKVLLRSRCLPRALPDNVLHDNPLMLNTTVIKMVTGLSDAELVLVNFHNKLFEVPYYVALDHEKKSIVVAIRGTLSIEDILTDLSAYEDAPLPLPGVSEGSAHEGMYHSAQYLYRELLGLDRDGVVTQQGVLERARAQIGHGNQDYRLVIVGHSLGAGVAAVLALLMNKHEYYGPRMWCFSYSPPGGLLSLSASRYAESILCSVVLGDDLVPRLGVMNMYDLKVNLLSKIRDMDRPKHEIFQGWFRNLLSSTLGVSDAEDDHRDHSWAGSTHEEQAVTEYKRSLQQAIDNSRAKLEGRDQMYPPGCVIYVERVKDKSSTPSYRATYVRQDSYLFREIILSKTVVADHTPWAVLEALTSVSQETSDKRD